MPETGPGDLHRMTALLKALPRRRAPGRPEPAVDRVKPLDPATSRRRHRERRAGAAAFWIFAVVVAALYLPLLWSIAARIPASYDEGWNAYNAEAAIGGGMLYPPRDALIADNYPPLSFYVVGGLGRLVGDDIIAGRLIAAASLLVVAGNVFLVLRALDAQPLDCGFGALLFLAYTGTFFRGYVAIDEPQWLGHALETGGLVIFLKSRGGRPAGLGLLAPALMAIAGFVKANLVPLPLAVMIWCAIYDRALLRRWLAIGIALGATIAAACYLRFGADFISDVLLQPRPYSLTRLLIAARKHLGPLLLPIGGGVWLYLRAGDKPPVRLILLWAALGGALGLIFVGGAGVNYNAFFDLAIALCVAAGLLVAELRRGGAGRLLAAAVMLLLAVPPLTRVPGRLAAFAADLGHRAEQRRAGREDIAFLAAQPGPAACEMLALCYWAGKAEQIDFFNTEQKIIEGAVAPDVLIDRLDRRWYGAIALTDNPPREEQLPPKVMARLRANYRLARVSPNGWTILVPVRAGR